MGTTQKSLSLDEFRDNVNGFVHDAAQQCEPVFIQPADGPSVVLQNAESYQQIVDRLEHFEFVEAVRKGLRAEQEGRVYPAFEALSALQNKLGLPD